MLRDIFVQTLLNEAGYHEGHDSGGWNNEQKYSEQTPGFAWSDGQPWCATFECWGAWKSGIIGRFPMTASCYSAVHWWQEHGRWTQYPVLGAPFYMGDIGEDHTGVVYRYDENSIWTIEGNTNINGSYQGDGVYQRIRPRRNEGSPYGYGVVDFGVTTISADPSLGGVPRATVPILGTINVSLSHAISAANNDPYQPQGHTSFPADVRPIEIALSSEGLLSGAYSHDGSYGTKTRDAMAAWQRRFGFSGKDADGVPGKLTLTALGSHHGFKVIA